MSKNLFLIIILTITSAFNVKSVENIVTEHLETYAKYNQTQHDNIDDNIESHAHTHRHGENEQEHEHHHDHEINIAQVDTCLFDESNEIQISIVSIDLKQRKVVKNLISSAHPSEILRPPIC